MYSLCSNQENNAENPEQGFTLITVTTNTSRNERVSLKIMNYVDGFLLNVTSICMYVRVWRITQRANTECVATLWHYDDDGVELVLKCM